MKKIIFIGLMLFAFFGLKAQSDLPHYAVMTQDTITDTGTVTFTLTNAYDKPVYVAVYINSKVLTGTGAGTISYQTAERGGTTWFTFATDTIQNSANAFDSWEGILYGQKLRMSATGTGTQSTQFNAIAIIKEIP